jgi:PAS domain S-box-containing protein
MNNMTDLKLVEAELKASIKEVIDLKTALDAHAIVATTDPQGKITYVNDKFCAISQYSREELIGRDHRIINSGFHSREFMRDLWTSISNGKVWHGEIRNKAKDGTYYWVDSTIVPFFDENGNVRQYVAIRADITERKRMEDEKAKIDAQHRQLQKAESLGLMAGAIAHHYNNLLMAVMGNLELAMMGMPQGSGTSENLTEAMHAARKAAAVSGLMLTYLGYAPGRREPLDLSAVCASSPFRDAMPKYVVLESDLPHPGPYIAANLAQIQQVLTNLATNAWEACGEEGGVVRLSVKTVAREDIALTNRVPIDWQPQDVSYACLEVTDTGSGIATGDIEKLFDPFFSTKFTGRGMGLAVVLGIARAHDGVVTVLSAPGRGSTFRVFFPKVSESLVI